MQTAAVIRRAAGSIGVFVALILMPLAHGVGADEAIGEFRGGMTTVYPHWFKDSFLEFADDVEEAAESGKRVMIIFHQDNCPYCNALVERNLSQVHIEQKIREHFDVVAINMWGDRDVITVGGESFTEKDFARALRVQFTPTILIFDERGKVALRLNGYLPPGRFEAALDYAAGKMESTMTYNEYLAETSIPAEAAGIVPEDFCTMAPVDLSSADPAGRPTAVLFEQAQCPNCETLHEHILSDESTRAIAREFRCIQLDMWSDDRVTMPSGERVTARQWAGQLDVKYAPTIVLFDAAGREVIRSEAWLKTFHTQTMLDYVASGAHRSEPEFQRYLTERADRLRRAGKDVDIWE